MKTLIATLMISVFGLSGMIVSDSAEASYGTSTNYGGNTTYHNFGNGSYGTSTNYGGNTTYHNFSNGQYGTSTNYGGNTTYHNFNR